MEDLGTSLGVFWGTVGVSFLAWLIVHFNGKTVLGILALIRLLILKSQKHSNSSTKSWLQIATEAEVIILGLTPIAIASLISTSGGNCHNSIQSFLVTEVIIFCLFLLVPNRIKLKSNFFGEQFYRQHWTIFAIAIAWCLGFTIWGLLAINPAENQGIDRLLVNQNVDMWFYIRRFAAFTTNNLNFDARPACFYLQISPKKFSSFLGSIIVYFTPKTVFGITLFQGLLGCSLFLSLFGNWTNFTYKHQSLSRTGTILASLWAIFSPAIFWLLITSYLSNALFITIFVLGLTAARRISLNSKIYPQYAKLILLFSFIICVFSFYIVFLPVALSFYLATLIIYQYEEYLQLDKAIANLGKLLLAAGLSVLFSCIFFKHQINLSEVTGNLNALKEHGKNFVPLNPWSLVQEKPNPMPNIKDFGLWFNIVVGVIFSSFVLNKIYRGLLSLKNQGKAQSIYYKDLIAAASVIGVYVVYLLAYIPLEYTYRLGKFAVSIIYPLAILGILPTLFWFRDRYYRKKSRIVKLIYSIVLVLHIVLHIDKTLYLRAQPIGKYKIVSTDNIDTINNLTIVRCTESSISQKYQKIVGLDLAKQYPDLAINVITDKNLTHNLSQSEAILKGMDVIGKRKNLCIFKINL